MTVSKPEEEYLGYAHYEAQRVKRRLIAHQCLALIFLASFFTFPSVIEFVLAKYGPQMSPAIIPPPPYYVGETIKGLSTKGEYHTWVYTSTNLWVDP